ncbi:cAMP-binding domain of CRP or a regulatory subunit of cAMP-dependent protein kinases [Filimonas lacunae]|uniref:cAMP-binding domain of CRP or a regulatory subunit of cAMP-dependent protein kinases n=1 Tax=Filimonas lacunae TaxID=477680 RepID=A0A173MPL2_9BACT|nr:Crp/Fnr family transcriptional regulator [Filimonas lacunae]BAV09584.1 Crp/Fnr family transcriptional regulator [Filimonas lacunae]SIS75552.1 cAMP-binding domain of CRP or a regulatory subunit of cAMP-dependent protein kinases [Filimonas lacunae]
MAAAFESYFREQGKLNEADIEQMISMAEIKMLHRNELLLQQGQVSRHKIFVVKGLLRMYGEMENGSEHTLRFSPENSWTLDVESYDLQAPAKSNIAAVEDSEVLLWKKADFEHLLATMPQLNALSKLVISQNIYNSRKRLAIALSATPEEKYDDFIQTYPGLLSRVPLRMIASYLGISLKTLTRIRHAQVHR